MCVLEQEEADTGTRSAELNICRKRSRCLLCVYFSHCVLFFSRKQADSFGTASQELPRTFWELREMPLGLPGSGVGAGRLFSSKEQNEGRIYFHCRKLENAKYTYKDTYKDTSRLWPHHPGKKLSRSCLPHHSSIMLDSSDPLGQGYALTHWTTENNMDAFNPLRLFWEPTQSRLPCVRAPPPYVLQGHSLLIWGQILVNFL